MKKKNLLLAFAMLHLVICMASFAEEPAEPAPQSPSSSFSNPVLAWGSIGPGYLLNDKSHWGSRIALGADVFLNRSLFLGGFFSKPFADESIDGRFQGSISRTYFFPNIGYYFIPKTFYGRAMVGLGLFLSSNVELTPKLKDSFGLGLGYHLYSSGRWKLNSEFNYEYSGAAKSSLIPIIDSLVCAVGDCDGTGTVPRAHIWSLNLIVGYEF